MRTFSSGGTGTVDYQDKHQTDTTTRAPHKDSLSTCK